MTDKNTALLTDPPGSPTPVPGPHGGKVTNPDIATDPKSAGCVCVTMSLCNCASGSCASCPCTTSGCGCPGNK